MSLVPKRYGYVGKHCFAPCNLSRAGKTCQCKFDRMYERQSFEKPGADPLKINIPAEPLVEAKSNGSKKEVVKKKAAKKSKK